MEELVKKSVRKYNNVTYKILQYKEQQEYHCVRCKRINNSNQTICYYERGLERKICSKCFDKVRYPKMTAVTTENKKKKVKKKNVDQNSIKRITDPMKKVSFDNNHFMSAIELYIADRDIFLAVSENPQIYGITVSKEIKQFLNSNHKYVKNVVKRDAILFLAGKWREKKKNSTWFKSVEEQQEFEKVIRLTQNGELQWQEESNFRSNTRINAKYSLEINNGKYIYNITGYRNSDNEMRLISELLFENAGEKNQCPAIYNKILYQYITKYAIKNGKEKETYYIKKRSPGKKINEIHIESKDFVVRTNLFRCFHKEHLVEEIIGIVDIIDSRGQKYERKVPAAYCSICNCFYILTSEYNNLSASGVILCQLIDKDEYYKNGTIHESNMKSNSLLMRNGYNVKNSCGLTELQRQAILKNIIDKKILLPHKIVSYLDMFISQKNNLLQYNEAVGKWKKDRMFVLAYNENEKRSINIERIMR